MNLRYIKNKPFFKNLQVISTPGHHKYARISNLQGSINGDIYLFTDKGFLSLKEAKEFGIGGEYGIYIQF
jgi:ribosomal protein S8